MTEPTSLDEIRADLVQIDDALTFHFVRFPVDGLRTDLSDALRALSRAVKTRPARPDRAEYEYAATLTKELQAIRTRLEVELTDGTLTRRQIGDCGSALFSLNRGLTMLVVATAKAAAQVAA